MNHVQAIVTVAIFGIIILYAVTYIISIARINRLRRRRVLERFADDTAMYFAVRVTGEVHRKLRKSLPTGGQYLTFVSFLAAVVDERGIRLYRGVVNPKPILSVDWVDVESIEEKMVSFYMQTFRGLVVRVPRGWGENPSFKHLVLPVVSNNGLMVSPALDSDVAKIARQMRRWLSKLQS